MLNTHEYFRIRVSLFLFIVDQSLRPIHTEQKWKLSLMSVVFTVISFACSLLFFAFAWCE